MHPILRLAAALAWAWVETAGAQPAPETPAQVNTRSGASQINLFLLNTHVVPPTVLAKAEIVATRIFAGIAVSLKWHTGGTPGATRDPGMNLEIQFDSGLAPEFHAGTLGYAMPYGISGTRIHVFSDRVIDLSSRTLAGAYLGHVIAHEVTHILEGISRHSTYGVMKARWDVEDFYQMVFRPLPFASDDVELIHQALELRFGTSQRQRSGKPPE